MPPHLVTRNGDGAYLHIWRAVMPLVVFMLGCIVAAIGWAMAASAKVAVLDSRLATIESRMGTMEAEMRASNTISASVLTEIKAHLVWAERESESFRRLEREFIEHAGSHKGGR